MKIKEVYEVESGTRKRWYNYYQCDGCGVRYRKQKRLADGAKQEHYCSSKCFFAKVDPNSSRVVVTCAHCNVEFPKLISKLSGSKSGKYFCSREHKDLAQAYLKDIQPDHYNTGTGEYTYREKALKAYPNVCISCGYSNISALEVHHIDKNRQNNDLSNLEILCANCHTLEHKGLRTGVQR